VEGQTAWIRGPTQLKGSDVRALDIRSGAAVILAALVAEGKTTIADMAYVDRGYERIHHKLTQLGARIERVENRSEALVCL
jgi:UDP-N-acetylglucosamine 1-carboxyvinyltransferase